MSNNGPVIKELERGVYNWCSCGKTSTAPFCDNSHEGTPVKPLVIKVKEKRKIAFCACGRSRNIPFCDGSHSN